MKSQKRTFVVEHKNGRRRSLSQPKSIWGDTDFKALTRDAQKDAAQLFAPISGATTYDVEEAKSVQTAAPVTVVASETVALSTPSTDVGHEPVAAKDAHTEGGTSLPMEEVSVGELSSKRVKRRRKGPPKKAASRRVKEFVDPTSDEIDGDHELRALSEENRRLRERLREQLLQENIQLRRMLSRFG